MTTAAWWWAKSKSAVPSGPPTVNPPILVDPAEQDIWEGKVYNMYIDNVGGEAESWVVDWLPNGLSYVGVGDSLHITGTVAALREPVVNAPADQEWYVGEDIDLTIDLDLIAGDPADTITATPLLSGLSIVDSDHSHIRIMGKAGIPVIDPVANRTYYAGEVVDFNIINSGDGSATWDTDQLPDGLVAETVDGFTLRIHGRVAGPPVINDPGQQDLTVDVPYSLQLTADVSPTSWAGSGFPTGVSINTSTGEVSGTPTVEESTTATVTATNAEGTSNPLDIDYVVSPAGFDWGQYPIKARYDVTDLTTMWEDESGTIQAQLGSAVARIDDQSGNGFHLIQSTAGSRATVATVADGSGIGLQFDGTDYYSVSLGAALSEPQDVFLVHELTALGTNYNFLDGQSSARKNFYSSSGNAYRIYRGTATIEGGTATTDLRNHLVRWNTTDSIYIDGGAAVASGDAGNAAPTLLVLGARFDGVAPAPQIVRQVVMTDGALTTTQVNEIGNHLSDTQGLNWTDISGGIQSIITFGTTAFSSPQLIGSDWATVSQWDRETAFSPDAVKYQDRGFEVTTAGTFRLSAELLLDPKTLSYQWVEGDVGGDVIFFGPEIHIDDTQAQFSMPTVIHEFQVGDHVGIACRTTETGTTDILNILAGSYMTAKRLL